MRNWIIDHDVAGQATVTHTATPRFTAHWTTVSQSPIDADSGGEDGIQLDNVRWLDPPPNYDDLKRLMAQAAHAIDGWIAERF